MTMKAIEDQMNQAARDYYYRNLVTMPTVETYTEKTEPIISDPSFSEDDLPSSENKVTPHDCLTNAAGHLKDRASTYGSPKGERSMAKTVDTFAALTDIKMSEEQGWMFMAILKMVRSQAGDFKLDNYEDGAAYFALAAEAASENRT